jgi:hypothetical protein
MVPIMIACCFFLVAATAGCYFLYKPALKPKLALVLICLMATTTGIYFASYPIAHHMSRDSAIGGYHQFLNGSVLATDRQAYTCTRDGDCEYDYNCDYYYDTETEYYTDSEGNTKSRTVEVRKHHDCPYAKQEFSYTILDSLGTTHSIGDRYFAKNPQEWRRGSGIPSQVPRGEPAKWVHARKALAAGNSDPVVVPDEYKNYVLADESTLLRASSDDISLLSKQKLLPDHTQNLRDPIHDYYVADKMSFVGFKPINEAAWQSSLMHFNAALGMEKQGDMHIVAIKASAIPASVSPEDYLNALKAYWLNNLGKYAIAKNGIALVLAVDDSGSTIEWSKAATGMPVGNGPMLQALSTQLSGTPFTPANVLGSTTAQVTTKQGKPAVTYTVGKGKAAQIIMHTFPFKRACMMCKDKGEDSSQSFVDLASSIPISTGGVVGAIVVSSILGFILWYKVFGFVYEFESLDNSSRRPYDL